MSYEVRTTKITGKDGKEYLLKPPKARFLARIMSLPTKQEEFEDKHWDAIMDILEEITKKSYPDWTDEEKDAFVTDNMVTIMEKLPVITGQLTEKQLEEQLKNPKSQT